MLVLRDCASEESRSVEQEYLEYEEYIGAVNTNLAKNIVLIILGTVTLVGGAHLLVQSSVYIARVIGISELIIGLTIIAIGTSLPELATSMVASIRKESDISVGNILGSNIFNILAILGIAAMMQPIRIHISSLHIDMLVMLLFSILLVPMVMWKFVITRIQGVFLLVGYSIYILYTVAI